ncbi:GNAT family N-acetyltransferase [Roseofilum casamattae]|uniref:N-acetyltransferase n=1 Tax=Roseofilum casamattae BLCC-M143 TaxID=3022442 RepID=A0ABT7C1A6_9CYAN|nr:N-acetyltransferase [Roseofilum casamattae]MDJ1185231.1 N-acetyltransferase [Roseofilum casamattae BLCC-M143]
MNHSEKKIIKNIHFLAFGEEEGEEIAKLAEDFLKLPETISISVKRDRKIVGNVLFTPFAFKDSPERKCYLLAPLGVLPEYQRQGVGKELIETGIKHLKSIGTDAIFVLGVPTYYPQYGFVATDKQTPYPDLLTMPEAWMMLELNAGSGNHLSGETIAVEPFMHPTYWDTSGRR